MLPIGLIAAAICAGAAIVYWMLWRSRCPPKQTAKQPPNANPAPAAGPKETLPSARKAPAIKQAESGCTQRSATQVKPTVDQSKPRLPTSRKIQATDRKARPDQESKDTGPSSSRPQSAKRRIPDRSEVGQRDSSLLSRESGKANLSPNRAQPTQDDSKTASQDALKTKPSRSDVIPATTDVDFAATAKSEEGRKTNPISELGLASKRSSQSISVQADVTTASGGEQVDVAPLDPALESLLGTASFTAVAPTAMPGSESGEMEKLDEITASPTVEMLPDPAEPVQTVGAYVQTEVEHREDQAQQDQREVEQDLPSTIDPLISPNSTRQCSDDASHDVQAGKVPTRSVVERNPKTTSTPPETDRPEESSSKRINKATKTRAAPKYQPAVRTAKATRRRKQSAPAERQTPDRKTDRARTLSMSVHVSFGRRNQCRVSLLPSRISEMPESIDVKGPDGIQTWDALQDEWYCDVVPADFGAALKKGCLWELADTMEDLAWTFSGRDICVLAQGSTISGYVSVPRLMLGEDHIVLCTDDALDAVEAALSESGCEVSSPISGTGVPRGWHLFSGVCPTVAVHHEGDAGILNILRPIHDVDIVLRHGIRLSHSKWLHGHPPQIRIRGRSNSDVAVLIDETPAGVDESGSFVVPGWDDLGLHTVFCGGQTQTYELVKGVKNWERFDSFQYRPAQMRVAKHEIAICGPIVDVIGDMEHVFLTPPTNSCLLGAVPGQVARSDSPYKSRNREYLALADFPVVWTVPLNALRCDKSRACIKLIQREQVENGHDVPWGTTRDDVLRWCRAILDASRKHLPLAPDSDDVRAEWLQYKNVARRRAVFLHPPMANSYMSAIV